MATNAFGELRRHQQRESRKWWAWAVGGVVAVMGIGLAIGSGLAGRPFRDVTGRPVPKVAFDPIYAVGLDAQATHDRRLFKADEFSIQPGVIAEQLGRLCEAASAKGSDVAYDICFLREEARSGHHLTLPQAHIAPPEYRVPPLVPSVPAPRASDKGKSWLR